MADTHSYEVRVTWQGDLGTGTSGYRAYSRDMELSADGKSPVAASSDPAFRGDPARWSPEDLFVASLSQCHLLWYLHLCADAGVVVAGYVDDAGGTMQLGDDGSGRFTEVVLRPRVTVAQPAQVEAALALHADAARMCFLANSVAFPVRHEPEVVAALD
ncbi:OsmC family protein [Motilibacter aurantiacus]|uniref:OsmC family protein n=1 Tax=Motilibacter aurantiacus TaxID=2714955 RepID=UPI002F2B8EE0